MKRMLLLIALVIYTLSGSAQDLDLRIEPPNWWSGMVHNNIQVLVYGDEIAVLTPRITSELVTLERVTRVENNNYLFLDFKIPEGIDHHLFEIQFLKKNKVKKSVSYEIKPREENSHLIQGFDASDVMYLITPDRFANGNQENDLIEGMLEKPNRNDPGGRHGGDIQGISDNLDYISDLGFTAIWLNPIIENDMAQWSYHGYAATDFYKVDERFGTNQEYTELIQLAKKKDIKVIMDMIMNHCGSEHWFVKDPPCSNWLNLQENYSITSHRRTTVQDIHASEIDKASFSDGWFVPTMPDLNQKNELMSNYLIQNTIWWIEYSGISGIRMDTYPYPDKHFMTDWTCAVMDEYPNFSVVGEEWTTNASTVAYWQAGKENHDGYTSCLPSVMDFPLQDALAKGLLNDESWGEGLIETYRALSNDYLYANPYKLVIFPDNHDMDRTATQFGGDISLVKMAMVFYSTMRGTPQFYYGTEIFMDNDSAPGDHLIIRTDFPGGWESDMTSGFTGESLSDDSKELQEFTRALLNWRKTRKSIHEGDLIHFVPVDGIYVYFRSSENESTMMVFNKNDKKVNLDLSRFNEITSRFSSGTNPFTMDSIELDKDLEISEKSALIFELK